VFGAFGVFEAFEAICRRLYRWEVYGRSSEAQFISIGRAGAGRAGQVGQPECLGAFPVMKVLVLVLVLVLMAVEVSLWI
jgi:hypothetical protein